MNNQTFEEFYLKVAEEYSLTKSGVNNRIYKAKRWLQEEFRKVYE